MTVASKKRFSTELLSELESNFFWWEPVTVNPRSPERVLAQAMDHAPFETITQLEAVVGPGNLADVMIHAGPGWFSDRSWELWRGRLKMSGQHIPSEPPRRSF